MDSAELITSAKDKARSIERRLKAGESPALLAARYGLTLAVLEKAQVRLRGKGSP